jgi:formylglycine-generating enzyme required for sulfatase activity
MAGKDAVYYKAGTKDILRTARRAAGNTLDIEVEMDLTKNGYRLPTEAEWEYAARGGGTPSTSGSFANRWAGTDTESDLNNYAWYSTNSGLTTHPVGEKTVNNSVLGLYDMSGNIWEWCWDWYDIITTTEIVSDPTGPTSGEARVLRGGCCTMAGAGTLVAYRTRRHPAHGEGGLIGFRVAFSLVP